MNLSTLIKKGSLREFATATPATPATHNPETLPTVATVATVAVAIVANDGANDQSPQDLDRWCWPASAAMNGAGVDTFTVRLAWFTDKGLNRTEAETLADKLVIRDREGDDRRLCLECANVRQGGGLWGCSQWRIAKLGAGGLAADLVRALQRCGAFKEAIP